MSQRDIPPPLTDSDVTRIAAFVLRHVTVTMRQADRDEKVNDIKSTCDVYCSLFDDIDNIPGMITTSQVLNLTEVSIYIVLRCRE